MSVLNIIRVNVGEVGVKPGTVKMVSSDNLATVTAAGYINGAGLQVQPQVLLAPSDVVECLYNYDASDDSGSLVYLRPSVSAGVITLVIAPDADSVALAEDLIFVGAATGLAAGVAMSGDVAIVASGATTIQAGAIDLAMLSAGITPSHVCVFAGEATTAGGDANESITVTGALATDLVYLQLHTVGATPRTILSGLAAANAVNSVWSGDPSTDHVYAYQVLRAAS